MKAWTLHRINTVCCVCSSTHKNWLVKLTNDDTLVVKIIETIFTSALLIK